MVQRRRRTVPEAVPEIVRAVQAGTRPRPRAGCRDGAPLDLFKAHSSLRIVHALAGAEPPRPILPLPEDVQAQALATVREMGLAG